MSNKDETKVDEAWRVIGRSDVAAGQVWRHSKTQSRYEVIALSVDEVRLVPVVTYQSLSKPYTWTRDLDVFVGINEEGVPRFVREP